MTKTYKQAVEWDIGYFLKTSPRSDVPTRGILHRLIAWELDERYYDGLRANGYGGFLDDGRWLRFVPLLIDRFGIPASGLVVDLGCKKGFILRAFKQLMPSGNFLGIENHSYPIDVADQSIKPHLRVGPLFHIPYADGEVDFLIAFSSIYMQTLGDVVKTLREIQRVAQGRSYITVGAYRDARERELFRNWTLIGTTVLSVDEWRQVFSYAQYTGNVFYTTPQALGLH